MPFPLLGCGLGLRTPHYPEILRAPAKCCDWFEAITENYMDSGGRPIQILEKIRENYPIGLHGVALSIGSVDPLHPEYLKKMKALIDRIQPEIVSDHICWSGVGGEHLHDLLPLPFTEESLKVIVEKTEQVQEYLGRQILLENASTYVTFKHSAMPEWEFVREIAKRSACGLLLDINNVYVNAYNHKFDAREYLQNIPGELVGQIHLAGHTNQGKYLFDTHGSPVIDEVWKLYEEALALWGKKTTLIEWDADVPPLERLVEECEKARGIYNRETRNQKPDARNEKLQTRRNLVTGNWSLVSSVAPPLRDVQLWMQNKIEPLSLRDGSSQIVSGEEVKAEPSPSFLNPQGGDPGTDRLEVYRDGYFGRTEESLKEVFEAVAHLVGAKAFHELAANYARHYSSPDYNLNTKGNHLPDFLPTTKWGKDLPFLPDLARLEWKISVSFNAYALPTFQWTPDKIQQVQNRFDEVKLQFQSYVHILKSNWPIFDLWQARKTPVKDIKLQVIDRPEKVLVSRRTQGESFCRLLSDEEYFILEHLIKKESIGIVMEKLAETYPDSSDENKLTAWFSSWIRDGLIAKVE